MAKTNWILTVTSGLPTVEDTFRAHLRLHYKDKATEKPLALWEDMAGENVDYPEEWLRLNFK